MDYSHTILAVDDSATNILLLKGILEEAGYMPLTANSVSKAFEILEKNKVDLILLDLMMPKVSGFGFLKKIVTIDNLKDIPVIIISAKTDLKDMEKAKELGAVDYFVKPLDIKKLKEKLHSFFSNNS